jgi:hypothetical protein
MRCPSVANDFISVYWSLQGVISRQWTHAIEIRDRIIGRGGKGEIDIRELSERI